MMLEENLPNYSICLNLLSCQFITPEKLSSYRRVQLSRQETVFDVKMASFFSSSAISLLSTYTAVLVVAGCLISAY